MSTLKPQQNGHHFVDDTSKCIFLTENLQILIQISLRFIPKGPINMGDSGNGLAPNWFQAITWSYNIQALWRHMASIPQWVIRATNFIFAHLQFTGRILGYHSDSRGPFY